MNINKMIRNLFKKKNVANPKPQEPGRYPDAAGTHIDSRSEIDIRNARRDRGGH